MNITNINESFFEPVAQGNLAPDRTYVANENAFVEAYFSQPLTQYALGWGAANPEIPALLEFVAPMVPTPRRFEYNKFDSYEAVASDADDIRHLGSDFKRVEYSATKVNDKTYNKGLTIRVDLDSVTDFPNWEQVYTGRLMKRLMLNEFRRAIAVLKAAVSSNSGNTAKTWDGTAGQDPDVDMLAAILAGNGQVGQPVLNRAVYGTTAWQKRALALRAQTHAGGFATSAYTTTQLSDFLGLQGIMKSEAIYASGPAAKAAVVDTTLGTTGIVLIFNAESGLTTDDPSHIKRFVSNVAGGAGGAVPFKVYSQQVNSKFWDITVEHYSNIACPYYTGCRSLTIS